MPETPVIWIHLIPIFFAIVVFFFVTILIDAIHTGVTKRLLWPPSCLLNWDRRDFIPNSIWWKCVLAQFAIRVGGWLFGANDDYVTVVAVLAIVAILFGFGCAAVNNGIFSKSCAALHRCSRCRCVTLQQA